MTTLSSRQVSLSDHVKRRRSSAAFSSGHGDGDGGGRNVGVVEGGAPRPSRGRHLADGQVSAEAASRKYEGGYDSHAASYGNYDAPSAHCRSYGASEVGCYASEPYIGAPFYRWGVGRRVGSVNPLTGSFTDPTIDLDLEGQRLSAPESGGISGFPDRRWPSPRITDANSVWDAGRLRMRQARTLSMGPREYVNSREAESSNICYPRSKDDPSYYKSSFCNSLHCPSAATASTASSGRTSSDSGSSINGVLPDDDTIRRGIIDASALVATYVAGPMSFIVGIFLALASPFVRVIRLVIGDLMGLLGDAVFLRDLGSLWRMYRRLRRRGGHGARHNHDDESTEAGGTFYTDGSSVAYTDNSSQYVGGWKPRVYPSAGGSSAGSAADTSNSGTEGGSSWAASAALGSHMGLAAGPYPSLPVVSEDRHHQCAGLAPAFPEVKSGNEPPCFPPCSTAYQRHGPLPRPHDPALNPDNASDHRQSSLRPRMPLNQSCPMRYEGSLYLQTSSSASSASSQVKRHYGTMPHPRFRSSVV